MNRIFHSKSNRNWKRCVRFSGIVFMLLAVLQSCIFEDMEDCVQYDLTVKLLGSDGEELVSGTVDTVNIYLFDRNGFVRMIPIGRNSDFTFGCDKEDSLTLVAWGNLKQDSLIVPTLSKGETLEEALVSLRWLNGCNMSPTDLFYSRYTVLQHAQQISGSALRSNNGLDAGAGGVALRSSSITVDTMTLSLERMAATLIVTGQYMDKLFGTVTTGYRFVVRNPRDAFNFLGNPVGDTAVYEPGTTLNAAGQIVTPVVRVLPTPTDGALIVELYRGDNLLYSTSTDSGGEPLRAVAGKQLNVLLDFRYSFIQVTVTVVPWGTVTQDTEL
jgi:hypothetical protein